VCVCVCVFQIGFVACFSHLVFFRNFARIFLLFSTFSIGTGNPIFFNFLKIGGKTFKNVLNFLKNKKTIFEKSQSFGKLTTVFWKSSDFLNLALV